MAEALGVPVVRDAVYPYDESPSLDIVMSYITGSSIQWGSDPRITSAELTETAYLLFGLHVIPCGLSLTSTLSLYSDECFCTPLFLERLLVFLTCSFVL